MMMIIVGLLFLFFLFLFCVDQTEIATKQNIHIISEKREQATHSHPICLFAPLFQENDDERIIIITK